MDYNIKYEIEVNQTLIPGKLTSNTILRRLNDDYISVFHLNNDEDKKDTTDSSNTQLLVKLLVNIQLIISNIYIEATKVRRFSLLSVTCQTSVSL